jgi:acyl-CoA thioesterase FadM
MCKKADVLDAGGYLYDYEYFTYVNKARKALFSHLFVDDHTADEIEACIVDVTAAHSTGWRFFVRKPLHPSVQHHLQKVYA